MQAAIGAGDLTPQYSKVADKVAMHLVFCKIWPYRVFAVSCLWITHILCGSYCYTVRSAIGITCFCPSVCPSVRVTVHCGTQGRCSGLQVVPSYSWDSILPINCFRHFCCTM